MNYSSLNIIGILGGYGPYATIEFYKQILDLTPSVKDWDHFPVLIDSNPRIPSRVRSYLFNEESPVPYMIEAVDRLKKGGAAFFTCPCNSAHYFIRNNKSKFSLPFIDMVEESVLKVKRSNINKVGIIGSELTCGSDLYRSPLKKNQIDMIPPEDLTKVRTIIEAGKQQKNFIKSKELLLEIINELTRKGAQAILYACTELTLVLPPEESPIQTFDTNHILAQATIKQMNNDG